MEMIILRTTGFGPTTRGLETVPVSAASLDPHQLLIEVADVSPKELLDLRRDPEVDAAPPMPTKLIEAREAASSAAPEVSWGVRAVGAADSEFSGDGVTVAVLDTGIAAAYASLPTFAGLQVETKNFTTGPDEDTDGHGTHCAGTIFGRDTEGCRIGVAPGVSRALIGKVLGRGGGSTQSIFKAILWAYQNGAQVISMSLGMDFPGYRERLSQTLPPELATSMALAGYLANVRLFDRLSQVTSGRDGVMKGTVVVAAAGNESRRDVKPNYRISVAPPAAADLFVSVAAIAQTAEGAEHPYEVAKFSNIGARVAAPGVDIWSLRLEGGLKAMSGTSMATPHVAGVAALWIERSIKTGRRSDAAHIVADIERATAELPYLDADDVGRGLVKAP
jgi:subtilisin family serine protease